MNESEFWSATDELKKIHQWARARYAAPWAVLGAVLLRVAASTGPHVQLPPVVGGHASLNLGAIFVGSSGGGKGISEKVARLAWPAGIVERPLGSGEGIAALFMPSKKEGAERVTRAILSVPEIDTLTGMAARQGSILLAQLKSALMGELIGQSNASEATTRVVQAHSYRCCLSIGAQPGHAAVILNDTSGGTPQRMLWFPTTDPTMPDEPSPDPEPLNHRIPGLLTRVHDGTEIVTEMIYGPAVIAQTIRAAQVAKGRGEVSELDGHAVLARCKVAAVLAIMDHRTVVSDLDWDLSEHVMQMSDRTRNGMIEHARQAARAKVHDRAQARAEGDKVYDDRRLEQVRRSILNFLETDGEHAEGKLRKRFGSAEKRLMVDAALPLLESEGLILSRPGEYNGSKTTYWSRVTEVVTPQNSSSEGVTELVTRDHSAVVTDLDFRSSHDPGAPKLSCKEWLRNHVARLREAGQQSTDLFAVLAADGADNYHRQSIISEASVHPGMTIMSRRNGNTVWWIDTTQPSPKVWQPASQWVASYVDQLPDGTVIDYDDFKNKGLAADYSWENLRKEIKGHRHIDVSSSGPNATWTVRRDDGIGA